MVLNRTYKQVPGLTAQVGVYGLDSKQLFNENVNVSLEPTDVKEISSIDNILKEAKGISFIVLNLKNSSGKVISRNFYWISKDGDYTPMNDMEKTNLNVAVLK